jgi:hypothetical protein
VKLGAGHGWCTSWLVELDSDVRALDIGTMKCLAGSTCIFLPPEFDEGTVGSDDGHPNIGQSTIGPEDVVNHGILIPGRKMFDYPWLGGGWWERRWRVRSREWREVEDDGGH